MLGDVARAAGCDEVILYQDEDFIAHVKDITGGLGCAVVYDSVGNDTFTGSLACLALRGHLVNFGQASGVCRRSRCRCSRRVTEAIVLVP